MYIYVHLIHRVKLQMPIGVVCCSHAYLRCSHAYLSCSYVYFCCSYAYICFWTWVIPPKYVCIVVHMSIQIYICRMHSTQICMCRYYTCMESAFQWFESWFGSPAPKLFQSASMLDATCWTPKETALAPLDAACTRHVQHRRIQGRMSRSFDVVQCNTVCIYTAGCITHIYADAYVCRRICMQTHMYGNAYVCRRMCMETHMYADAYVCRRICMQQYSTNPLASLQKANMSDV